MDRIHALTRQTSHALAMLATLTPDRRRTIQAAAAEYLDHADTRPAYAYRMRGGQTLARTLGIASSPTDPQLPGTARAVLAAINATVTTLTAHAEATGQPALIAMLHILGTDPDPDMEEALRRVREGQRPAVTR